MPAKLIQGFVEEVKANKLKVDSIIISKGQDTHSHYFVENAKRNGKSLSKVVTGLAVGIAYDKGLIHPEDHIMDYFEDVEITEEKNKDHLKKAKVKHLLTMTLGHERPMLMERHFKILPEDLDYISHVLNTPISHEPGTFFAYTNGGTYLLSAIIQRITGMPLDKWAQKNLFTPLGMEELHWDHSNQGICRAATGLHLDVEDAHKIGLLLLNEGAVGQVDQTGQSNQGPNSTGQETQIVSREWMTTMKQMHVYNQSWEKYHNPDNNCLKKIAYGYHIWPCGDGSQEYPASHFFGDGADGQQLIICPQEEMVIAIMARLKDSRLLEKIICEKLLAMCYY